MDRLQLKNPPETDPGVMIADTFLRDLYYKFLASVCGFHDGVRVETARLDVRIFWRDGLLCRVAPYRELFHVQVGKEDIWETRVRNRAGCVESLDRVLARFLDLYTTREGL